MANACTDKSVQDKPTPPEEVIPEITLPQQSQTKEVRPNPFAEVSFRSAVVSVLILTHTSILESA
jgi:hypothetical protein